MIVRVIFGEICVFIGGALRWIVGNTIASISGKKKFSFKEYHRGVENPESGYEAMLHGTNNYILGLLFIFLIIILFTQDII